MTSEGENYRDFFPDCFRMLQLAQRPACFVEVQTGSERPHEQVLVLQYENVPLMYVTRVCAYHWWYHGTLLVRHGACDYMTLF